MLKEMIKAEGLASSHLQHYLHPWTFFLHFSIQHSAFSIAWMNLPNALTLARIFLVPLLVVVLVTKFEGRLIWGIRMELVGAAIFGLASLTDWLDGYLPAAASR